MNEYYKGKGTFYLCKRSGDGGLIPIGNATEISLAITKKCLITKTQPSHGIIGEVK
jgi:hypothetical protein